MAWNVGSLSKIAYLIGLRNLDIDSESCPDVGEGCWWKTSNNIEFLDSGDVGEKNVGDKISAHS